MPSDILNTSTQASTDGEYIIPFFAPDGSQGFNVTNQYWYMENGWESIGPTEDMMTFRVQAENVNNYAFDIVMNPDGVLSTIKFDTPVIGVRFYTDSNGKSDYDVVWAGFVEKIRQVSEGSTQYCQVSCTSVKKLLRDIPIRGSYCWDGESVVYRDATPLHLNRGGRPDWTFSDDGIAMPAINPDWGLDQDEEPPDPEEQSSDKATYCTLGMLLQYLYTVCSQPGDNASESFEAARDQAVQFYAGLQRLPSSFPFNFIWPASFGQQVDQFIVSNFNNAVGQNNTSEGGARKGRDIRFRNGAPLISNPGEIGVLDTIFAECGGFSYAIHYGDFIDVNTPIDVTLACVPTRFIDASQALTLFYAGGQEQGNGVLPLVREIDYEESCKGTYTRMVGVGSSVKIETRIDSTDVGEDEFQSNGILYGWSTADLDGWRTDSVVEGVANAKTMYMALKKYPHLFSRFAFDPNYDFSGATNLSDNPIAAAARPIWPFLLSYQGASLTTQANDIVPFPIRVEVDQGTGFADAGFEQDGLVSWDNGYFELPIFRDVGIQEHDQPSESGRLGMIVWNNGWANVVDGMLDISLADIRVTVAIPHDSSVSKAMKAPFDSANVGDEALYDNAPDSPDANRMDANFTRTMVVDLTRLYDLWLRIGSYPIPESAGGIQFLDRDGFDGSAVRDDSALLAQNVNKMLYERNRLERSGYFRLIGPLLPPQAFQLGCQISQIKSADSSSTVNPFTLNCCIQMRKWMTKNTGTGDKPKWSSSTDLCPI